MAVNQTSSEIRREHYDNLRKLPESRLEGLMAVPWVVSDIPPDGMAMYVADRTFELVRFIGVASGATDMNATSQGSPSLQPALVVLFSNSYLWGGFRGHKTSNADCHTAGIWISVSSKSASSSLTAHTWPALLI